MTPKDSQKDRNVLRFIVSLKDLSIDLEAIQYYFN